MTRYRGCFVHYTPADTWLTAAVVVHQGEVQVWCIVGPQRRFKLADIDRAPRNASGIALPMDEKRGSWHDSGGGTSAQNRNYVSH
jgi:hypothetical protein